MYITIVVKLVCQCVCHGVTLRSGYKMDDRETSMDNICNKLQSLIEDCDELQKEFENYRKLEAWDGSASCF